MKIIFSTDGWQDYILWQKRDPKGLKRLNRLIDECSRTPFVGIGKPEPLRNDLSGFWSRRIDHEHRLVYRIFEGSLEIAQCRGHY